MRNFVTALVEICSPERIDTEADGGAHEGQSTAEYVIIVTIVVALATVIALFRDQIATMIQNITNALTAVA